MSLRVVFMGTPEFALPAFETLARCSKIVAVVTQPDRPQKRGQHTISISPIKAAAEHMGIPVLQPLRLRSAPSVVAQLSDLAPELIVTAAFGQILPQSVLNIPKWGCLNLHASLLPHLRGGAPIQWALIRGKVETGVTIMQMDAGLDTGPILRQRAIPIGDEETHPQLSVRLAHLGADLLGGVVADLTSGQCIQPIPQSHIEATRAPLLTAEDGKIRWDEAARDIYNRWRATIHWPGAVTVYQTMRWKIPRLSVGSEVGQCGAHGEILRLTREGLEVAAGTGYIILGEIQPEGRRSMTAWEYARGHTVRDGVILGVL